MAVKVVLRQDVDHLGDRGQIVNVGSSFAPSLIDRPLPYARFREVVEQGSASGTSVMRGFADDANVMPHIPDIYLYLEARAAGRVGRGRPAPAR